MTILFFVVIGILAVGAIVATVTITRRDGYGRTPTMRLLREYERDDHYRA